MGELANQSGSVGYYEAVTRAFVISEAGVPYDGEKVKAIRAKGQYVLSGEAKEQLRFLRDKYLSMPKDGILPVPSILSVPLIADPENVLAPAHLNMLGTREDRAIIAASELMGGFLQNLYDRSYAAMGKVNGSHYIHTQMNWILDCLRFNGVDVGDDETDVVKREARKATLFNDFYSHGTPLKYKLFYTFMYPERVGRLREAVDRGLVDKVVDLVGKEQSSGEGQMFAINHPELNPFAPRKDSLEVRA